MSVDTNTAIAAVSLEEAKAYLRVDDDASDEEIEGLCLAATQLAEHELQRPLVTRDGSDGYGEANDVPAAIKLWIKQQVACDFSNRDGAGTEKPPRPALLDPFRTWQ